MLYEGRQIYFGPAHAARTFFLNLGFACAERATTADFLTSLTSPAERIIRAGWELRVPRTAEEFEQAWRTSIDRTRLLHEIEDFQLDHSNESEELRKLQHVREAEMFSPRYLDLNGSPRSSFTHIYLVPRQSPYTVSFSRQTAICIMRGFQRLRNNLSVPVSGIAGNAVLGAIIGSAFYNLQSDTGSFYSRGVLIFLATLLNATSSAFEVSFNI